MNIRLVTTLYAVVVALGMLIQQASAQGVTSFDPASIHSVTGYVTSVYTPEGGLGVHLTLKTKGGTVDVHLGPAWYLQRVGLRISKGDRLSVAGADIMWRGRPAMVASTITKNKHVVTLRDRRGVPLWAGRGNRWR